MEFLDLARNVLVILHFIGLASLLGGFLTQMSAFKTKSVVINQAILHGALTQLVTGLLLVAVAEMGEGDVNHMKIGIKLAILIVITVLVFVYRKRASVASWVVWLIGALTLTNIIIAVVL